MSKEVQQTHNMGIYIPMDTSKMLRQERLKALSALMFLVKEHSGDIKARKYAVGRK